MTMTGNPALETDRHNNTVPVPDPTKLTTDAVNAATEQWRRELSAMREVIDTRLNGSDRATELIAERLTRLTDQLRGEVDSALVADRRVVETRLAGMDKATEILASNVSVIGASIDRSAAGLKEIFETRLHAMDVATNLLATNVDKVPYAILQEAGNLKALIMSTIDSVRDVSNEKFAAINGTFASNALALTAALAAQKEAAAEQNKSNTLAITKSEQATKETIGSNAAQTSSGLSAQDAAHQDLKERVVRLEAGGLGRTEERTDQRASASNNMMFIMGAIGFLGFLLSIGSFVFALTR